MGQGFRRKRSPDTFLAGRPAKNAPNTSHPSRPWHAVWEGGQHPSKTNYFQHESESVPALESRRRGKRRSTSLKNHFNTIFFCEWVKYCLSWELQKIICHSTHKLFNQLCK